MHFKNTLFPFFPLSRLSPGALVTADFCSLSMKNLPHPASRFLWENSLFLIDLSLFYFCTSFPAGTFCSSTIPLNVVARLASPCRSDGTTIFVAFPFARTPSASRLFKVRTASSAPASLIARIPSAFACCTLRIASAWPSASRIRFSFSASARRIAACFSASASRMADCFLPSATRMVDFFSPSAIRIASRR